MGLREALEKRFGSRLSDFDDVLENNPTLLAMAGRGSCRSFQDQRVDPDLLELLAGVALSSPTKSDLQQRDIIIIQDREARAALASLLPSVTWLDERPALLVFCGNHRRQRHLHELRGHSFANDHLDAFFNAACDAAIALSAFVTAAEAIGLGCCPISAIRNEADAASRLLNLPDQVFPVAALAVGYPEQSPTISYRLPLSLTVHRDTFHEGNLDETITTYDARRSKDQPYRSQRNLARFGPSEDYGWSEDKARQYAEPERETFGAFVRNKGFKLL
ncbi:MAG: nitroreductase family protein [Pseudomonadota bacterium]